jgi:hypothetical protein
VARQMRLPVTRYRWAWAALSVVSFGSCVAPGCATSDKSLFNVNYREPGLSGADASLGSPTGGRPGGSGAGGASSSGGAAGAPSGGAGQPACVDANCPAVGPLTGCCTSTGICGVSFGTTCFAFPGGIGGVPGAGGTLGAGGVAGGGGRGGVAGGGGRGGVAGGGGRAGAAGTAGRAGSAGTGGRTPADSGVPNDAGDAAG